MVRQLSRKGSCTGRSGWSISLADLGSCIMSYFFLSNGARRCYLDIVGVLQRDYWSAVIWLV